MNDYLFKLKKDGKKVGYLKIVGAQFFYGLSLVNFQSWPIDIFKRVIKTPNLRSLSNHPFVTKDTNGRKVFADDNIKALYFWPDAKDPQTITGKVEWRDETFNWVLYHTPNTPEFAELWQLYDIELIEDKPDE